MKRLFLALVLFASPATARDLSITMNDALQQAYVEALDAYVKAGGINKATAAVALLQLLQQAAQQPDTPKPETTK